MKKFLSIISIVTLLCVATACNGGLTKKEDDMAKRETTQERISKSESEKEHVLDNEPTQVPSTENIVDEAGDVVGGAVEKAGDAVGNVVKDITN